MTLTGRYPYPHSGIKSGWRFGWFMRNTSFYKRLSLAAEVQTKITKGLFGPF
jgi:hypothetical protein